MHFANIAAGRSMAELETIEGVNPMRTVLIALAGIVAMSIVAHAGEFQKKKCKPGYEYDPDKGRCVLVEGS